MNTEITHIRITRENKTKLDRLKKEEAVNIEYWLTNKGTEELTMNDTITYLLEHYEDYKLIKRTKTPSLPLQQALPFTPDPEIENSMPNPKTHEQNLFIAPYPEIEEPEDEDNVVISEDLKKQIEKAETQKRKTNTQN
jgi:hypothetical protein